MELDKYRQAMSFLTNPKYINRDTVLIPFEGLSKEPEYSPMPNPIPNIDNVMPYTDGLEDPRNRQLELADGGIVEREGFANGKKLKPYGMTSYEMDQARIDNLNFEIEKRNKLGVKTIAPQLEKSTGYERSNINKLIQKGRVTRPLSKEELVTQYINKAIEENKTIGEMTKKAIGDYISADLPKGSKGRLENHTTAKIIKKQFPELFKTLYTKNSGALDQLARNTDLLDIPINDFIKDPTKIRRERSESTIRKGQNTARLRILQGKLKLGPRDFAVSEAQDDFIVNINNAIKKDNNLVLKNPKLMELVSTTFDNKPDSPTYGQIISKARNEEKIKADIKKGFFSNEHLTPKALEKMNTEFPTNKLLIPRSTNSNLIKSSQNYLKNNRNDKNAIQALEGLTNKFNININTENGKIGPKQGSTVEGNKLLSYENQLKTIGFNSPDVNFNIVKDIPKEELQKTKVSIKEQVNQIKELLNPQEQEVLKKIGTIQQLNSGLPIDQIVNALPEREAQILRGVGSKIGNIAKIGAAGLADLSIGLGPLGIGITAAVTAPFALYDISQGDRASEVLQNTASDLTFGLTPRADERIIKEIGGESAVRGYEIQQKIDEFKTARENLKNLNEQLNDPSSTLLSEDQDSILASIERNENILKQRAADIQPLIKDGKIVSPDYDSYLRSADKRKLEKKFTKEKRLEESNIYGGIEGETQTDFTNPKLERLEKLQKSLKKTYEENQPKPVEDIMTQYLSYGGRVGLKKGTKPPKPTIPINPLTDPRPENPDRRDFLKGAGALGLAIAAFGTGALKLAKTLKTKTALKVLSEPAVGQPEWFAPLVDKILLKGIRLEKDGKKLNKYVLEEDGKTITLETLSIPDKTFGYNPPGSVKNPININVKGGGAYDDPFDIQYYQRIDKGPGGDGKLESSFQVLESRPYRFGPDPDEVELSEEIFQGADLLELPKGGSGILSDMEGLEKIATGKIKNTKLANTRMKVKDELNQPDNYRSRYNPGEEDRMTRSTGPDGGEYYENLDGEDYYSVKMEKIRNSEKNDLDPDINYD